MVKGKRLSFYRRYPKYISLNLIQWRTLRSLTAIIKHADYWTLNLLRTRSKRNQLSAYLSFSRNIVACIGRNTKTRYIAEEKFIRKHGIIFCIVYILTAISNHQLRVILLVFPLEGYVVLRNSLLWILYLLYNISLSHCRIILDKNIWHFTWRLSYTFNAISPICKTRTKKS